MTKIVEDFVVTAFGRKPETEEEINCFLDILNLVQYELELQKEKLKRDE